MADESKKTVFRKIVVVEEEQKKKFLVGNTAPFVGKTIELNVKPEKGKFTIGRVEDNDFQIPFETVSSHHAYLGKDGEAYFIEDSNSSNGSSLNNAPLEPGKKYPLNHKDIIKFDFYEFIFVDSSRSDLWETLKPLAKEGTLMISMYSPKGGTGLTSMSVNLAHALAISSKKKVAIADFNFSFGDILTYSIGKSGISIFNLMQEQNITGDMITKYLHKGPEYSYLPAPAKAEDAERVNDWGRKNPALIQKILWSLEAQHDFVLIDMANQIDDITLTCWEISNLIYLVGYPEIGHMLALKKVLDVMEKLKYPDSKVKVLINRFGRENTLSSDDIKKFIKRDFIAIPDSPCDAICTSHNGQLYVKDRADGVLAQGITNLARTIRGEELQVVSGGIFAKLKSILGF